MKSTSDELREFYDASTAAEAAGRWPLLQQVWMRLGGEQLAPSLPSATKLHVQPPPPRQAPPDPRPVEGAAIAEDHEAAEPAPSLEDLFGRLR